MEEAKLYILLFQTILNLSNWEQRILNRRNVVGYT